jgi:sulfate permease, SulP family
MQTPTSTRFLSGLKLFQSLLPIKRATALRDALAGFTLAAMNVPQALGYTKIAGTPVISGLYTLLLPLVAFAALGSSRYLVVAADSATAAILATGLAEMAVTDTAHYLSLASLVALLTAGLLLLARLLKLGFLSDFLSRTVLVGFLTGVGFQVGIAVLDELLRLPMHTNQPLEQLLTIFRELPQTHWPTLAVSVCVITAILLLRRYAPKLPGALIAVAAAIAASANFDFASYGIEIIGPVSGGLPHLSLPPLDWPLVKSLLPIAGACFIMIMAQSAVTARAYATRHHQALDSNRDLLGLSAANAAAACSGTFVVNGSPTQTAMVESSGGSSQLAHLSTALVVMLVLLFLIGPLQYLPVSALGAIVFTIAIHLIDLKGLDDLRQKSQEEWILALITAAAVVVLGVEHGILLAIAVSLLDHVRHGYRPGTAIMMRDEADHWRMEPVIAGRYAEPGLIVYWFGADLYYASANHFSEQVRMLVSNSPEPIRCLVIDAGAITGVDYSAGGVLRELHEDLEKQGVTLAFAHVNKRLINDLDRLGLTEVIGKNMLFDTLRDCVVAYLAKLPKPA